jgi:hypothetical protein
MKLSIFLPSESGISNRVINAGDVENRALKSCSQRLLLKEIL